MTLTKVSVELKDNLLEIRIEPNWTPFLDIQ